MYSVYGTVSTQHALRHHPPPFSRDYESAERRSASQRFPSKPVYMYIYITIIYTYGDIKYIYNARRRVRSPPPPPAGLATTTATLAEQHVFFIKVYIIIMCSGLLLLSSRGANNEIVCGPVSSTYRYMYIWRRASVCSTCHGRADGHRRVHR